MVHIVVIAHAEIANSFVHCIEHVLVRRIDNLHIMAVKKTQDVEYTLKQIEELVMRIGQKDEILLLTDLFGATPSNIASHLVNPGKVEMITGLNMPMLIRAVTYANKSLKVCVEKALEGAKSGIIYLNGDEKR